MFKNMSISLKFTLVFIVSVILVGLAYFFLLRNIYEAQLLNQARMTADYVEAFGAWVSRHGRVWVKDDFSSFLGKLEVVTAESLDSGAREPDRTVFYSKNPALAQREFSEVIEESELRARFRMTSDNFMNPLNKPDAFEAEAIEFVKQHDAREYTQLSGDTYRYARTVIHKESCITCHGIPEEAPQEVTAKYGTDNGFGFKADEVAGVISVALLAEPLSATFYRLIGPVEVGLVILAFLIAYLYMRLGIIKPVQRLTETTDKLSLGEEVAGVARNISKGSRNEIDQLRLAVNRLRNSMQIAIHQRREKGQKKGTGRIRDDQ